MKKKSTIALLIIVLLAIIVMAIGGIKKKNETEKKKMVDTKSTTQETINDLLSRRVFFKDNSTLPATCFFYFAGNYRKWPLWGPKIIDCATIPSELLINSEGVPSPPSAKIE